MAKKNGKLSYPVGHKIQFSETEKQKLHSYNLAIIERKVHLADSYMRLRRVIDEVDRAEKDLVQIVSEVMQVHGIDDKTQWNVDIAKMEATRTE